jgi:hypothetical protein
MSIRLNCRSCRTAFVTAEEHVGRTVACPKCGTKQKVSATVPVAEPASEPRPPRPRETLAAPEPKPSPAPKPAPEPADDSVFVPSSESKQRRRFPRAVLALFVVATVAAVAVAVAWPSLRRWWHPVPPDPVEVAAANYLQALTTGDTEAIRRLGTLDVPPAIRSFQRVRRDREQDRALRGSFAPIGAFHAQIEQKFVYDPEIRRFKPRNELGPAAETLDALHDAKAKMEADAIAKKIQSGNPDDLFDAAEGLGKVFTNLAEGALAPKKIIPTYAMLVEEAKPPLPEKEKLLADDFGAHPEAWDALLKRPFLTLKADGPFIFEQAEVIATVRDRLASLGDPPTPMRLTLTRFRLEGIDTLWKVTAARRILAGENAAKSGSQSPKPTPAPTTESQGRYEAR